MSNVFAINVINIKINEMMIFNINNEKIIISLFIYEMINVIMCANELNNIVFLKNFNVINLTIVVYLIIYIIFFA